MGVRVNTRTGPRGELFTGPSWWIAALLLAGAILLQTEVMGYVRWRGAEPSLVLMLVVWYSLRADWTRAVLIGLIAGVCEDSLGYTGAAWTLATPAAALLANTFSRWIFADSVPAACAVVMVCTLARRAIAWIVMALQGYPPGYARIHFHDALWSSLLNGVLLALLMLLRRRQ